jgi:hypothetical protein
MKYLQTSHSFARHINWSIRNQYNSPQNIPYFPAHKMHRDFSIISLETRKNNDECILILVIYCGKKTGLLHTKISNHNTIYSS